MSFTSALETIGKGFEKGLKWAMEYAVPVEKLVGILFPEAGPIAAGVANATSLIQTAVRGFPRTALIFRTLCRLWSEF